jgi:hypothetical protein
MVQGHVNDFEKLLKFQPIYLHDLDPSAWKQELLQIPVRRLV